MRNFWPGCSLAPRAWHNNKGRAGNTGLKAIGQLSILLTTKQGFQELLFQGIPGAFDQSQFVHEAILTPTLPGRIPGRGMPPVTRRHNV